VIATDRYDKILISQFNYGTERKNMEQEMTGQKPVERQLNRTSETDPKSPVTFIYRGDNPFMKTLMEGLRSKGVTVHVKEISDDDYARSFHKGNAAFGTLIGEVSGIVVTDQTLNLPVSNVMTEGLKPINAYDLLGGLESIGQVQNMVRPTVEAAERIGRKLVVLDSPLSDHTQRQLERILDYEQTQKYFYNVSEKYGQPMCIYSVIIHEAFGLPVIGTNESRYNRRDPDYQMNFSSIVSSLEERNLSPEEVLVFADHHLRKLTPDEISLRKLDQVDIILGCPCCIGAYRSESTAAYEEEIRKLGLKIFPLEVKAGTNTEDRLSKLMEMIEQKRAELKAQGGEK
jgi:hypothetical protein